MSTTIDNRVVEMQFDNRDFESNVKTSMGTLEKLKEALQFKDTKGNAFDNISSSIKNVSFGPLNDGIDSVKAKFSALDVAVATIVANITNSVLNAGKRIASEFTLDQINAGFAEYELKMGSIQTILANAKTKDGLPVTLDMVNQKLEELNTYADRTIYSFSDMTSNIGKFTNAGVDLDTAVAAIQGISNVAAVSGANANEASRAMYNFAQALSAGYVKLIDWKSIENANMATVEFKEQLLESAAAAGTVEKTADGMYQVLSKNANGATMKETISATKNFNDSLAYQWMTTDVLTGTLEKYADETTDLGKKAFAAAQDVKTFSQLIDTTKEAIGSGWAESFQIIIGDFEEAKKLWTGVNNILGDIIQASSDSRNALLKDWKALGGRTALITAVRNAWDGLASIAGTVKDAFREVFPPLTGKQLADISKKIQSITASFKNFWQGNNGQHLTELKNAFTGVFTILKFGVDIVKSVISSIGRALGVFDGVGSSILSFASDIGLAITSMGSLDGVIESVTNTIGGFIDTIAGFIKGVGSQLNDYFDIKGKIASLKDALGIGKDDLDALDTLQSKVKGVNEVLSNTKDKLSEIVDKIKESRLFKFISTIGEKLGELGKSLGKKVGPALDNLIDKISKIDIDKLLSVLSSLSIASAGFKIANPLQSISDLLSGLKDGLPQGGESKGLKEGIMGFFGDFGDAVKKFQEGIDFQKLIVIAGAIAILAASVVALSKVDTAQLAVSIGAITALFADLVASASVLGSTSLLGSSGVGSLMGIATAVLIMSGAVAILAKADPDNVSGAITALMALVVSLVVAVKLLNKNAQGDVITKGAGQLILLAVAINLMAIAVKSMAQLKLEDLAKGLMGIGTLLAGIVIFVNKVDNIDLTQMAATLLALSFSLVIMAGAVKTLGSMQLEDLGKGLAGLGAVLLGLYLFINNVNTASLQSSAAGLVALSVGLLIIAGAIKIMGSMDIEHLAIGLVGLGGALLAVGLFVNFVNPASMVAMGAGLLVISAALVVIAGALKIMGSMKISEMGIALLGIVVVLGALAVALNLMTGALPGAAALVVAALALQVMGGVLLALSLISLGGLIKALLGIAGVIVIFAAAAILLTPALPVMLGLGAAMLLFGAGMALLGAGLVAMAAGITSLVASFYASGSIILSIIPNLIRAVLEFVKGVIIGLADILGEALPALIESIGLLIVAICDALINAIPKIIETLGVLLDALLPFLTEYGPKLIEFLGTLITNVLEGLAEKVPEWNNALMDIGINVLKGLGEGLEERAPEIREAMETFIDGLVALVMELLGIHSPSTVFSDIGVNMLQGMLDGITSMVESVITKVQEFIQGILDAIAGFLTNFFDKGKELFTNIKDGIINVGSSVISKAKEIISNVVSGIASKAAEFRAKGRELFEKLKEGIGSMLSSIKSKGEEIINNVKSAISNKVSSFTQIGRDIINGMLGGISEKAGALYRAGSNLASNFISSVKNKLDSHSPSRVFMQIGRDVDSGLIIGLEEYGDKVNKAAYGVADESVEGMRNALRSVSDIVDGQIDSNPTIRPILDLSDIANGASQIGDMLDTGTTYSLASQNGSSFNKISGDNYTRAAASANYGSELVSLRNDFNSIIDALSGMKVVMDSGELVGSIVVPMDKALGRRSISVGRSVR